jgi:protein ImuA
MRRLSAQENPKRPDHVAALREAIAKIERRTVASEQSPALLSFEIAEIDQALGGGLPACALHEVAAWRESELAAASGFACAVAAHRGQAKPVLWAAENLASLENGYPYGPGLDEMGLSPERLVLVTAQRARDVLWVMEEALRCSGIGAVIGEIRSEKALDDVAGRRLALACEEKGGLALLLRAAPDDRPFPAATRWIVEAARSGEVRFGVGPPALHIRLIRNRNGRVGDWRVEWHRVEQRFFLASAHFEPVAAPAADRPHRVAVA